MTPAGRLHDDCRLAMNAVIAPGATVGKGCIVGDGAVDVLDAAPD
jgi:acetyltransferase-like isoleucine patch superfamily enzyme